VYVVQPGDRIENIAEDLGLPVERLLAWNDLTLDSTLVAGQRLEVLPYAAYFPAPTPIPQSPATKALKSNSDSAAIHQKIGASSTLWHTLWIDVQTVDYGPAGYIGSPRIYHSQAWIEQPAKSLELMGLLGEEPSSVSLVEEGRVYQLTPESEIPTLSTWNQKSDPLLQNEVLREMVYPNTAPWGQQKGRFEAFGTEDIAMREALGVDWINESGNIQARLWLDKETGVLLRIQEFGGPDYGTLESDSMATALLFDLEIPGEALFDPHSLLTQDYATLSEESGADGQQDDPLGAISISVRPRLPDDPPPVDFNPASSQLHFQFPEGAEQTDSLGSTADEPATLFADGYTLGETMIYPPWGLQCERSPDGQHVVYNKRSDGVTPPDARLRWINVKSPQEVYEPLPGIAANSFAFAPDSRHLAVFGADPQMNTRSIYIVDLGTGESWPLVEVYQASSLVWSPDGSHLAFIGQKFDQRGTHIMIVHVRLEEIIFERPVQLSGSTQEFSWSSMAWGMEFPIPPGDMGTCATPPSP
jgi:hypothetical protein